VIIDLDLPGFSGDQTARALRDRDPTGDVLIIAMSRFADDHSALQVDTARFHARLLKPLDLERLQHLLREHARGVL
jgi:CheY-like chemotaxis protein